MASISKEPGGRRRIQFVDGNDKRRSIRLGKCSQRFAENVKLHVEALAVAKGGRVAVEPATLKWVREISDELARKLARVGLIEPRKTTTLGELVDGYIAGRKDVKPSTLSGWGQAKRSLFEHFGKGKPLRTITRADAERFRESLTEQKLAHATISKRLQFARQFFAYAVKRDWLERNPFEGVTHKSGNPAERQYYVTPEDTQKLIDAAPNWVWRTIIALARYGGLRCPSEVLSLRLADLDWERGAMVVRSPKTEGHGQGHRIVPMFARLRPYLNEAWDMAAEGQTHVIPENLYLPAAHGPRGWVNCNLRTSFSKIVDAAGLDPWPRLFHALRASCESDLAREYPITTVCKWIGNTVSIASRHYIQVTDADFQKASKKVVQNPAQLTHETAGEPWQPKQKTPGKPRVCQGLQQCTSVQVHPTGLEPVTFGSVDRCSIQLS